MKKSVFISLSKVLSILTALCALVSVMLACSGCNQTHPSGGDTAQSAQVADGKNTFVEKGMPLEDNENLLTASSYNQLMYDVDADGTDDRITCATLDKEADDAILCIQFGNGTTPDAKIYLSDGYTHPELFVGRYEDTAVIYVRGESQGSDGEQMVHPFIYDGTLRSAVAPDAKYMTETSLYNLSVFKEPFDCEYDGAGHLKVSSEHSPDLYITIPGKLAGDDFDDSYGMRIITEDCTMDVDAGKNSVSCSFYCAIADPDRYSVSEAAPVILNVVLEYDGETFFVRSWKYDVSDGIEYSMEGDIPAPTPMPTPSAEARAYEKTIELKSSNGSTVTSYVDADGDGTDERVEIVTDNDYNSKLTVYSGTGKAIYEQEGEFFEVYIADLTQDGRKCIFIQHSEEEIAVICAYFLADGKLNKVKTDMPYADQYTISGYIEYIWDGEITLALRSDLMGTRDWTHTAFLDKKEVLRLSDDDYISTFDTAFKIRQDAQAKDKSGKAVTIKSGALLKPISSDMKTYIWFEDESGNMLRMSVKQQDWQYMIGGVVQDDLFDGIGYAG